MPEPLLSLTFGGSDDRTDSPPDPTRHVVAYDRDGAPCAYGWRRNGDIGVEVPDVATFHLSPQSASLTAISGESVNSAAILDAYYGTAMPLVVQAARGLQVIHASAVLVASESFVVAFCGISESGKSTVAYGLNSRGYDHWADDAVAFRADAAEPVTAVGLPFTINLRERSAQHFGAPDRSAEPRADAIDDFQWESRRLGGVFLLEPLDRAPSAETALELERLAPADALHALLPNAYRFQPQTAERRRETLDAYLELVASVPILRARFPAGFDQLDGVLDELERWMREAA